MDGLLCLPVYILSGKYYSVSLTTELLINTRIEVAELCNKALAYSSIPKHTLPDAEASGIHQHKEKLSVRP